MQYRKPIPAFLREAAATPTLQRLKDVGMHCGCQYTAFPQFRGLGPYSRYDHSLAVARILWDFTSDPVQTMAGLLHDGATPAFSHVVDFLNGDHLTQESTEAGLLEIIKNDTALMAVLDQYDLDADAVADFGRYPLADNPSPRLCADRLEYTLSNAVHYGFATDVQSWYDDLVAGEELAFCTPHRALGFARAALSCGKVYVCDADRYAMERLSRLLGKALSEGRITGRDLYTGETALIEKLPPQDWESFCRLSRVFRVDEPGEFAYQVPAKKRCIDPLVRDQGRVSQLFPEFKEQMEEFLHCPQDYYICAQ